MAWNSAGSFFNLLCQWLITVLVLRLSVGYDAAGVYSYVMSVYLIFAPVVDYRLYVYQISDLHGEHTLGEYLGLRLITGGLGIVLLMAYSQALPTCCFPSFAMPSIKWPPPRSMPCTALSRCAAAWTTSASPTPSRAL